MNPEASLISAVCKNKDVQTVLSNEVDQFFTAYKDVWEKGVKGYYRKYGTVPDVSVIKEKFRDFEEVETGVTHTKYYVDELRENYLKGVMRNLLFEKHADLKDKGAAQVLAELMAEANKLNTMTTTVRDLDVSKYEDAMKDYEERFEKALMMGGTVGIPTGFPAIDSAYSTGMAGGHLIVVIGWPGKGKTWATANLACRAYDKGFKPMIFSLEMSPETMRDRVYTMMGSGEFRNSDFARGDVNIDDFGAWGARNFKDKGGFVLVSAEGYDTVTPNTVQAKIEQHRPDLVILDYHQLFEDARGAKGTTEQNKNISRDFKLLAVNNGIPVIDITAATMDDVSDQDSPPMLSQVAWSKAIEYDADMALAVHKAPESNVIEIVSRKNRHGGDFGFMLDWDIDRGVIQEIHG